MRIQGLPVAASGREYTPTPSQTEPDRFVGQSALAAMAPPGSKTGAVIPSAPLRLTAPDEAAEEPEKHRSLGSKIALAAGLSVVALGGVMAQAAPAFAQTVVAQDTTPVQVGSIQEVVDQFQAGKQFYVVGQPALNGVQLSPQEMAHFQQVLQKHPHAYVVLVARTDDVDGDDYTLSRGIGNSPEFQSVTNPVTGEKDAVVIMMYFNVDGDPGARKIFMRSEELPDRLGVGEQNFANEDGSPGELMQRFIDGYRATGSPAEGIGRVFDRVDTVISTDVRQAVDRATQSVGRAQTDLSAVKGQAAEFQRAHGPGGAIGNPPTQAWDGQLEQARAALAQKDYQQATRLAEGVSSAAQQAAQAMRQYEAAPGQVSGVQTTLGGVDRDLPGLEDNGHTQAARQAASEARAELEKYDQAYQAKDPSYQTHLDKASAAADRAASEVTASRDATRTAALIKDLAIGIGVVAVLVTAFVANSRARGARKEAQEELDQKTAEIGQKSAELLEILNTADFYKVQNSTATKQRVDALMKDLTDALTLVGGADKFLKEARDLVNPDGLGKVKNMFSTANYRQAQALLTDPEKKLNFSYNDSSRAVMEQGSGASTWREQLEKLGSSLAFEKSLSEVLQMMDEKRDAAKEELIFVQDPPGAGAKAVQSARAAVAQADSTLQNAATQHWEANGPDHSWWKFFSQDVKEEVTAQDLAPARATLAEARKQLSAAEGALSRQDYEQAYESGREAARTGGKADLEGKEAVRTAKGRFDGQVSKLESQARARREAEEARRRQEELDRYYAEQARRERERPHYDYYPPAPSHHSDSGSSHHSSSGSSSGGSSWSWGSGSSGSSGSHHSGGGSSSGSHHSGGSSGGSWGGGGHSSGSRGGSSSGRGGSGSRGGSW